jgi:hypothetical protein
LVPTDDDEPEIADAGLCIIGSGRAWVPGDAVAGVLPFRAGNAEFAGEAVE